MNVAWILALQLAIAPQTDHSTSAITPTVDIVTALNDTLAQYLLNHDSDAALAAIRALIEAHPTASEPRLAFARLAAGRGDFASAQAELDAIDAGDFDHDVRNDSSELRTHIDSIRTAARNTIVNESQIPPKIQSVHTLDVLAIARQLSVSGPSAMSDLAVRVPTIDSILTRGRVTDVHPKFSKAMSNGHEQLRYREYEEAIQSFLTAQSHLPNSLEPCVQLLVIASRQRSLELLNSLSPLIRGRMEPILEKLFEADGAATWIVQDSQAFASLANIASGAEADLLDRARRLTILVTAINKAPDASVRGPLLDTVRRNIATPALKCLEQSLRGVQ